MTAKSLAANAFKITILGAAGVRTPLIVKAMLRHQKQLGLTELALMDIDGDHLEIITAGQVLKLLLSMVRIIMPLPEKCFT